MPVADPVEAEVQAGWIEFHYRTGAIQTDACGLPAALSEIDTVADLLPRSVGLKATLMVQLARTAKVAPQE